MVVVGEPAQIVGVEPRQRERTDAAPAGFRLTRLEAPRRHQLFQLRAVPSEVPFFTAVPARDKLGPAGVQVVTRAPAALAPLITFSGCFLTFSARVPHRGAQIRGVTGRDAYRARDRPHALGGGVVVRAAVLALSLAIRGFVVGVVADGAVAFSSSAALTGRVGRRRASEVIVILVFTGFSFRPSRGFERCGGGHERRAGCGGRNLAVRRGLIKPGHSSSAVRIPRGVLLGVIAELTTHARVQRRRGRADTLTGRRVTRSVITCAMKRR